MSFDCLNIRHVYYIRIFCRNICAFKWKIYNFKVGFTDFFTATVKFEKNYDFFNLKISCIKEKLIFAGAVVLMATAAVTGFAISDQSNTFDLLNANVEALANGETATTWNCIGNTGDCYASCGICGTSVSGKGDLRGSHRCN